MKDMPVKLEWFEVYNASLVGLRRHLNAIKLNVKEKKFTEKSGWNIDIDGAIAEMAVCKALNIYWPGSVNTFKQQSDAFNGIEIRSRSRHDYELRIFKDTKQHDGSIYKSDKDESKFVLITGECPDFLIRGWMFGKEGKQDRFLNNPGGYGENHFINPIFLHDLDSLFSAKYEDLK